MRTVFGLTDDADDLLAVFENPVDADAVAHGGELSIQPLEVRRIALYGPGERPAMVEVHGVRVVIDETGATRHHATIAHVFDYLHGDLTAPLVEVERGPEPGVVTVWVSARSPAQAQQAAAGKAQELLAGR
ncbi:hypothetical protein [Cryptosporangium sp. NPDC048952]|uniref:hypothetical protein n=1 Tax=Cryptosporangium sp. NPDC048952 TaxID=3363961 RepID=UPI003713131F